MAHIKTVKHDCGQLLELYISKVPESQKQLLHIGTHGDQRAIDTCPTCSEPLRAQNLYQLPKWCPDDDE